MLERVLDASAGKRKRAHSEEGLLRAIWGALNIARENKALIVTKGGIIINTNELAAQLCERTHVRSSPAIRSRNFWRVRRRRIPTR